MLLCIQQTIIVSLDAHFLLYEHQRTENVALEYIYCEGDTNTTYSLLQELMTQKTV